MVDARFVLGHLLLASCLALSAGCAGASASSTGARADGTIVERVDALGVIDPAAGYLFYLHPKIVEEQGLPAVSPDFGAYEYEAILDRLAGFGFTVVSEVRPKEASSGEWAERIGSQVEALLAAGVPPERVTVVGASKGAYIAALVSHAIPTPGVRYVILSMCDAETVEYMKQQGYDLHGDVLALRDAGDVPELVGTCEPLYEASPDLGRHDEIVVHVGTGHGILFRPIDEWVLPVVDWARGTRRPEAR